MPATLVLVLDRSNSMKGTPMDSAKRGAMEFIKNMKPRDQLMVILFNHEITELVPLCAVRECGEKALSLVDGVFAEGNTSLHDVVHQSYRQLRELQQREPGRRYSILLLSDGKDTSSRLNRNDFLDALPSGRGLRRPQGLLDRLRPRGGQGPARRDLQPDERPPLHELPRGDLQDLPGAERELLAPRPGRARGDGGGRGVALGAAEGLPPPLEPPLRRRRRRAGGALGAPRRRPPARRRRRDRLPRPPLDQRAVPAPGPRRRGRSRGRRPTGRRRGGRLLPRLAPADRARYQRLSDLCTRLRRLSAGERRARSRSASPTCSSRTSTACSGSSCGSSAVKTTIEHFFATVDAAELERGLARAQERLAALDAAGGDPPVRAKRRATLLDTVATTEARLRKYRQVRENHETVLLELERLHAKIAGIAELGIDRHDAAALGREIDLVASTAEDTERTMREIEGFAGAHLADAEAPGRQQRRLQARTRAGQP